LSGGRKRKGILLRKKEEGMEGRGVENDQKNFQFTGGGEGGDTIKQERGRGEGTREERKKRRSSSFLGRERGFQSPPERKESGRSTRVKKSKGTGRVSKKEY